MKNIKYSALVAIAAIAASCAKESTVIEKETIKDIPMEPMCIQTGDESETKTSLNGTTVNWTEGDQIAVYSNMDYSKGYKFSATNINDINRNTATFSGEVPAGTESFFAVYPPESVSSVSSSGAVVTIPFNQTPAEGTFGEELNITIAKGTKTPGTPNVGTIHFRNVCSYVKFTVPAYVSDVKSVTISSDNAIAGDLTIDYTGVNPSSTITANGKTSISMSDLFGAGKKTFIFVIAPGKVSNFRIEITTDSGNWTRTVSSGFTATAGKPVNLGTVDFKQVKLEAKAIHSYHQDGTLVGTDLSVNLGLDGFLNYASNLTFDVKKDGTTVRKYFSSSVSNSTVSLTSTAYPNYPYLPKGDYTIEGSYSRPDGSTQAISGEFNVPAPTFSVNTPSAYTNYDTYRNSGAEAANGQDGSTIFDIKNNGVTISSDILSKDVYASLIGGYSYTIDGNTATLDANGNATNQDWREHKVAAKFTFDKVPVESLPLTCHVTGLPFLKALPTEKTWPVYSNIYSWSYRTTTDGYGIFYNSGGYIQKNFYIPAGAKVPIHINHKGKGRKGRRSNPTTFNIYAGDTVYEYTYTSTDGSGETNTADFNAELTDTNYWVKCSSSYRYEFSSYAMTFNIEVLYL